MDPTLESIAGAGVYGSWTAGEFSCRRISARRLAEYRHCNFFEAWNRIADDVDSYEDRGLTFVSVDISGHEVPEFQPSAAYRHLELLLGRIRDLSDTAPFTTRPEEAGLQLQVSLGSGTGPV